MVDSTRTRAKLDSAFQQGNWMMVQHRVAQLLPDAPNDAELHFMLGVACLETRQALRALAALHKACELQPGHADWMAYHAKALAQVLRLREAHEIADRAMAMAPDDPRIQDVLGQVYLQVHSIELAAAAFRRSVELEPDHATYRFNFGHTLAALGDVAGAERELEACIRLDPRQWPAHLSLSKLKRQTRESQHLDRLHAVLEHHGKDTAARIFLNMALGKEYEDLGDYPAAFEHFTRGKAAARGTRPASAERDRNMFQALIRAFPRALPAPGEGVAPDGPIFIVGMPRTGTTLLDRIVSSHPDVHSAGELQNFATQLQRASGSRIALLSTPDIAGQTRHVDWNKLGEDYIESTRPGTTGAPRFTDDMPHNFLYAGFIARALPNARILCLRRDPLDTCMGNFRQLFQLESGFYDYSLDLLDTGRYYIQFDQLMAHWRTVLPGRMLEVPYESLVQTPEPVIRRVLAFCGLPWNDACLHSDSNPAPVNTPNAWQVRAPIYSSAVGRWKHYAPQLGALRGLLDNAGIASQHP